MIKLIVGLGNPGQKYQNTRHNAGFLLLDYLAGASAWSSEAKFHGVIENSLVGSNKVILLKPQTFMNKSGLSVSAIVRYFKIEMEEILVAHDELDLDSGVVRLKRGGGHAGHNGLRDIIAGLGGKDFYRLRLGIGRPNPGKNVADFVLSDLSKQGWNELHTAFESVNAHLDRIVLGEMDAVMNHLNKK